MPRERDPFHKYVEYKKESLKKNEWKCLFCGNKYCGNATRIRAHLAGILNHGIKACENVKDSVRAEALETFNDKGSVLDKSTGGTSGKGTEGTVFGTGQSGLPSDDASNPNDMQNSNQLGCVPQQGSLPPDDRPPDNLDSDGEDPGSAEQFANEVLLDSLLGTAPARPQDQESLSPHDRPRDNLDNTQQSDPSNRRSDAAHGNENASSLPQHLMDSSALPSLDLGELLEPLEQSTHLEFRDVITPDAPLHSPLSNLHDFLPEEFREFLAEVFKEIEADELHDPAVVSSLQIDPSLDVDGANRLLDCGQPRGMEVVPVPSNRSPTNIVQHPGQLSPRCDKEDGNDIRQFPSPTQMEIDPSIASLHTSDSHILEATIVDSLVVEVSTDTVVPSSSHALVPPSSSQAPHNAPPPPRILPYGTGVIGPSSLPESDMNEGAPVMSHPNIGNDFEENRALKRKLLFSKEVLIRDELEFAASLSLKKPRMEVVNWLANVEKLRNYCTEAAGEDCLPPHQQVDTLMHEVEDFIGQRKGLFEARETKVNKLLEDEMVGEAFQRNTTQISEYLVGNQISRLGIYGMGGVGKTTIMRHIHNGLDNVLWINVSQDFSTQRLQDNLWKELGMGTLQEKDESKRAAMLCACLTERGKCTIILDDVWEHFDLKKVGILVREDGIKLVLTTRSIEVCRKMQCQKMINIEPLSQGKAESLFLRELKSQVALDSETNAIMKSIVRECAGLPLAIITMATTMRAMTDVFEWKDCLKKLRDSDMGETDMEKVVLKKLALSYNCLGKYEVQQCFLSCALYPEDQLIDKFELIEFFIDQGLFGPLKTREEQYNRGLTVLNKLQNVCLLEDHGKTVKMHDLIRDMALHVMSVTSIVKSGKGLRRIPSEKYWMNDLEKVSLMENHIGEFPLNMSPNCPKLSTLLLKTNLLLQTYSFCDLVIPDSFFKHLWGLKVLDLSGCCLKELPNSISNLVNLTTLLLRDCNELHHIPHLGKLRSLRKLDISWCFCVRGLEGLETLVNLRYLDITRTWMETLPKGTLGSLLNLQCLGAKLVNGEVTKLRALETLVCSFDNVDDFNKFVRVVSKQGNNPRYYKISMPQEGWDRVGETNDGALFQYRERRVNIKRRSYAIVSARGESNGSGIGICILIPQDVQNLRAWNCDGAANLSNMGPLEELEELEIKHWSNLRVLCGGQDEEVIDIHDSPTRTSTPLLFRSLRDLKIFKCPNLKYLFGHEPIFSLPHLQRIEIKDCVEMVGIIVVATSPPPYPPPAFLGLEEIKVERCGKMKRVVEFEWLPHFPNLRRIEAQYCDNMEEIIGGLSSYMSVEEISLERLLPLHLRNLQNIQVIGYKGMPEMIRGAGQGQEGSMTTPVNNTHPSSQSSISLPKLNYLHLHHLPRLKSICEVPITCNSMGYLKVIECQELNKIPLKLQLRDIEDLPYIEVEGEEMWKTLIWDHPDAQANLQSHRFFQGSCCILKGRRNFFIATGDAAIDLILAEALCPVAVEAAATPALPAAPPPAPPPPAWPPSPLPPAERGAIEFARGE